MRYTLLEMVQRILSAMDSDEVNDVGDTVESQQVVDVIETTYYDIAAQIEFPEHWDLFELTPSGDTSRPTLMSLPSDVSKLDWVQYDMAEGGSTVRDFQRVRFLPRYEFFERMNGLDSAESNVYQFNYLVDSETFDVRGFNDKNPTCYTTVDDNQLIFDNYKVSQDLTLVGNRTKCFGMKIPEFQRTNTFVADLDPRQFSLFFNEAKSQAFLELKQIANQKAEQRARRGWTHSQRKKDRIKGQGRGYHTFTPDYGRKR